MSVSFNSTLSNGIIVQSNSLVSSGDSCSFSMWVYPLSNSTLSGRGGGTNGRIFQVSNISSLNVAPLTLYSSNTGTVAGLTGPRIAIERAFTTTVVLRISSNGLAMNNWSHLALVCYGGSNAANYRLYVNGVSNTLFATNQNGAGVSRPTSGNLYIGNVSSGTRGWDGYVSGFSSITGIYSNNDILQLAKSKMITTLLMVNTVGNLLYCFKLDDNADGIVGVNSANDVSKNLNIGALYITAGGTLPSGRAEEVVSYQP